MNKQAKWLIGTGLVVGITGIIQQPIDVEASSNPDDYIVGGTQALLPLPNETEAVFSPIDRSRQSFYQNFTKRLDPKAGNRLYKYSEQGLEFWSPVRPRSQKNGGVSTSEYMFENFYTAKMYGTGGGPGYLGDLWLADPDITRNFKTTKLKSEDSQIKGFDRNDIRKIGKVVERSPEINNGGTFKGERGTWRFTGYASDGSSMMNLFFPPDYAASNIRNIQWDNYRDYGNRFFSISDYNTAQYRSAKRNLIKRLLEQHPEMKSKSVDQWMNILALQTEPAVNPKTGLNDGNYGGASFSAYHSGGSYYRSFVLVNDESQGSKNLGLMKLTITENKKVNGKYPVVATISRSELEKRDTKNKKISGKLVPGKTYRVVSTVKNANKLTATKHKPTTVDVGYSKNYNGNKIETDGVYNPSYDDAKRIATRSGNIGKNKSVSVTTTMKLSDSLKAGSNVRFGSIINDAHRIKGDNLNYNDDDLMIQVPVATGNLKAQNVVLVDTNGKEVKDPVPGKQYKVRYKFKYTGASQQVPTKVTLDYQHTRKLPDGNQEAIRYQNGSKTKDDTKVSKNITLKNGKSYHLDSKSYQWYEIPHIKAEGVLSVNTGGLNTQTKDDKFSKTWSDKYDYSVENLQVVARTERADVATDGKQHYGVSFTVNNVMPKAAANDNYAKDVNIRVNLGGETKIITEHLTAGKNKDIVVDFALDNPIKQGTTMNAKVDVNFDKRAYENGSGVNSNNSATTKVVQNNFKKDAVTGALINPTNNGSNTGAYIASPIDPNKMTTTTNDNPSNSWTQRYKVDSWKGKKITYRGLNGNKTYSFYRYTPTSSYTQNVSQKEHYKIQDVLMRSKVTSDNRWGQNNDGWVSMIDNPGQAQIKAGYGYELKMLVEYSTNAFSTQPNDSMSASSGTSVRPKNIMPNMMQDVYFQTSDGKILSHTGINSTNKMFDAEVLNKTKQKVLVEYTLKDSYALGVKTPGRIYISEDAPNGVYNVRAWTPEINGVATKNRIVDGNNMTLFNPAPLKHILGSPVSSEPSPLPTIGKDPNGNLVIDENGIPQMSIIVIGSDKDDVVNSVVQ